MGERNTGIREKQREKEAKKKNETGSEGKPRQGWEDYVQASHCLYCTGGARPRCDLMEQAQREHECAGRTSSEVPRGSRDVLWFLSAVSKSDMMTFLPRYLSTYRPIASFVCGVDTDEILLH